MKLSAQSQRTADALGAVRQISPRYWLAIDPDPGSAAAIAALGTRLVVRHYSSAWDFVGAPQNTTTPEAFVADCAAQGWFPYAWAVCTPVGNTQADPNWLGAIVRGLRALGKECIVGNWPTGNDGYFVPDATYYGCQEYGWPVMSAQFGSQVCRYRGWFSGVLSQNPSARLFITECGVTWLVGGGPLDLGYQHIPQSPEDFWTQSLSWYNDRLQEDSYVEAGFIFGCGLFVGDWGTFDILGTSIVQRLAPQGTGGGGSGALPLPVPVPAPLPAAPQPQRPPYGGFLPVVERPAAVSVQWFGIDGLGSGPWGVPPAAQLPGRLRLGNTGDQPGHVLVYLIWQNAAFGDGSSSIAGNPVSVPAHGSVDFTFGLTGPSVPGAYPLFIGVFDQATGAAIVDNAQPQGLPFAIVVQPNAPAPVPVGTGATGGTATGGGGGVTSGTDVGGPGIVPLVGVLAFLGIVGLAVAGRRKR